MKTTRFYLSAIAATALLFASCSSDDSPTKTPVKPGAKPLTPRQGQSPNIW